MTRIGVTELRQNAGRYLRRVAAGETIEITVRGRPIARLVPPVGSGSTWDRLVAEGRVTPAKGSLADVPPPLPALKGKQTGSEILRRMREHER
jgi:prevent-host-death family protein